MSPKPPTPPGFRPDLPRRPSDLTLPPRRPGLAAEPAEDRPAAGETVEMRKLIVGREIALSGEINSCDYLVVEGTVEARVRDGHKIEIADTGLYKGTVEVAEADIRGRFEGEITVRGRLTLRATGRIVGKIEYGELAIEPGGQLEGEIHGLGAQRAAPPIRAAAGLDPVASLVTPAED